VTGHDATWREAHGSYPASPPGILMQTLDEPR
jgi:hypothetical protein